MYQDALEYTTKQIETHGKERKRMTDRIIEKRSFRRGGFFALGGKNGK